MMTRDDTHGHARALTHTHTALGSFTPLLPLIHTHADVTNSNSHTPPPPSHASITLCVYNKTQEQSSGPTEVLKKMARNAALVVPDGMAHAMPASDTALAWGLESL